jgi:type I restriction enzyme S subunit
VRTVRLGEVLELRNEIVHPRDRPSGEATFVGFEHIESGTGRRIGSTRIRLEDLTGRKALFHQGDIVYGYLRPYLNKVWLAEFTGYCSVDQYVFRVRPDVDPKYVAWFLRSPAYLESAPIDQTPGQTPANSNR